MAQPPFNAAVQRIADFLGRLVPAQRAIKVAAPLTVRDLPAETLTGLAGSGEVTGATEIGLDTSQLPGIITSRIVAGTAPMRVNGGDSADLGAGNITLTIEPATPLAPGSMSAADKALLAAATVSPTPNTLLLRDPSGVGKCTSFEASSGGSFYANVGGNFVNVGSVDGGQNVQIGDTLQAASVTILAAPNGNIATSVQGTGVAGLTAIGAASSVSLFSDGFENAHAQGGGLSLASSGLFTIESTIGNYVFTASGATILSITKAPIDPAPLSTAVLASDGDISLNGIHNLTLNGGSGLTQARLEVSDSGHIQFKVDDTEIARFTATSLLFPNTQDATIDVSSVAAGNGKNLILSAGDVTAGVGDGGSFALITGVNPGGASGNVVCVMPLGSGGISGMFKLNDGTNNFLDAKATAALTTLTFDRQVLLTGGTTITLEASDNLTLTCGAGDLVVIKNGVTEVARFDAGGPPTPSSVGAANSVGTSTELALADHVHAHAYQQYMGANTITGTTTTRYLSVGFNTGTASANILDMHVRKPFKIDSLGMLARVGGTAGQTITATVRKNGATVGTAVLTTASDATSGNSSFTAVSYVAGDTWGLQVDKSGAIATSPTDIVYTVGMTPP